TMGAGIAQLSVQAGFETIGREVSAELGERGRGTIERYLSRGVEKGRVSEGERDAALARLTLTTELADLADCDLVIEAVLEELDKAMTNGAGWPMGPCALIDLIGVDVHVHASDALHGKLGERRMAPPERLVQMQQEGKLGRKSWEGFYRY